jgi:hypothetical protein
MWAWIKTRRSILKLADSYDEVQNPEVRSLIGLVDQLKGNKQVRRLLSSVAVYFFGCRDSLFSIKQQQGFFLNPLKSDSRVNKSLFAYL